QWLEAARTGIVVLQEESVDGQFIEERLGHVVVTAFRGPRGPEIPAAHVGADAHARWLARKRRVDVADVDAMLFARIATDARHVLALLRIVEIRETRVVELQIGATPLA